MQGSWLSVLFALGLASGFSAGTARAAELSAAELSVAELSEMEQLLSQLNFDPGAVDGEVDDRTHTAIRLYQEFAILPVDGEPSANLLRELRQVSVVFAEMREAKPEPEPEPETQTAAEPEPTQVTEPEVAAVEPAPATAPEIPEPPAEAELLTEAAPVAEAAEPEPEVTEPEVAAAVEPEPTVAVPPEPEPAAPELAEPEPAEPEFAELESPEPEPTIAVSPEPEPPEPKPVPVIAEIAPEAEPEPSEAQVAEAATVSPEPEQEAVRPAEPLSEEVPLAAELPAEPPAVEPKAAERFSIANMIARLKERDHADGPVASAPSPTTPTDRAGRERTLIWKVQQELQRIGLDPGAADGNIRKRMTGAISTYQRARGLTADGRVSEELLARLEAEAAPQPQSEAPANASASPQTAALEAAPSNGYQAFQAGYSAARNGNFDAAVKLYDQAISGGDLALEHLAAALYNRANAYQYLGVMEKAIEDYSAAIANKPSFPAAYYNRGFALDKKGEQGRAVRDFRKARDLGLQRLGVRSPDLPPPLL